MNFEVIINLLKELALPILVLFVTHYLKSTNKPSKGEKIIKFINKHEKKLSDDVFTETELTFLRQTKLNYFRLNITGLTSPIKQKIYFYLSVANQQDYKITSGQLKSFIRYLTIKNRKIETDWMEVFLACFIMIFMPIYFICIYNPVKEQQSEQYLQIVILLGIILFLLISTILFISLFAYFLNKHFNENIIEKANSLLMLDAKKQNLNIEIKTELKLSIDYAIKNNSKYQSIDDFIEKAITKELISNDSSSSRDPN